MALVQVRNAETRYAVGLVTLHELSLSQKTGQTLTLSFAG